MQTIKLCLTNISHPNLFWHWGCKIYYWQKGCKGTWRSALMSHSSEILLWSSSISMVTLKFCGAIKRVKATSECMLHTNLWYNPASYLRQREYNWPFHSLIWKWHFCEVPLLVEQQSFQWDSGFLSPEIRQLIRWMFAQNYISAI